MIFHSYVKLPEGKWENHGTPVTFFFQKLVLSNQSDADVEPHMRSQQWIRFYLQQVDWLVVWNMFFFHILGIIIPTDELMFFSGVGSTTKPVDATGHHWTDMKRLERLGYASNLGRLGLSKTEKQFS